MKAHTPNPTGSVLDLFQPVDSPAHPHICVGKGWLFLQFPRSTNNKHQNTNAEDLAHLLRSVSWSQKDEFAILVCEQLHREMTVSVQLTFEQRKIPGLAHDQLDQKMICVWFGVLQLCKLLPTLDDILVLVTELSGSIMQRFYAKRREMKQ